MALKYEVCGYKTWPNLRYLPLTALLKWLNIVWKNHKWKLLMILDDKNYFKRESASHSSLKTQCEPEWLSYRSCRWFMKNLLCLSPARPLHCFVSKATWTSASLMSYRRRVMHTRQWMAWTKLNLDSSLSSRDACPKPFPIKPSCSIGFRGNLGSVR